MTIGTGMNKNIVQCRAGIAEAAVRKSPIHMSSSERFIQIGTKPKHIVSGEKPEIMPPGFMYSSYPMHPFFGLFMLIAWLVQLVIAYFVYKDAKEQKMSAPLWFILVILPMAGFFLAVLYVIIREVRMPIETTNLPLDILKARFARGEISLEEFEKGKDALMK